MVKNVCIHTHTIPNEDEDAEDFEPVQPVRSNLQWGPRSTDKDQRTHMRDVQCTQQALNQPHQ